MTRLAASALGLALPLLLHACAAPAAREPAPVSSVSADMGSIAEAYVSLALAVGTHDPDYVDAYYGPPEWKRAADSAKLGLPEIRERGRELLERLAAAPPADDEMLRLRHDYLTRQLRSLVARVDMLSGVRLDFDAESRALYDAVAPTHDEAYFQRILDRLDRAIPGDGPLAERYQAWRAGFVIPPARLDTVFRVAIAACRERMARYIPLPPDESFVVEYVTDKPWSGYNWYQGGLRSVIQVNTDLPIYIDRAVDLACHEGYPGHHAYNMLLERELVRGRGWVEYTVYPLFSPQSLVAEGSANYGIDMAFPGDERVRFERHALWPLAGLDPATAARYYEVQALVQGLSYAGNEAARRYLNGQIDARAAADWLVRYALSSPAAAAQRVRFFDRYRSYVINYNLGRDLVGDYVESTAGAGASESRRWDAFAGLLSRPKLLGSE
jgi:hypothetical protein